MLLKIVPDTHAWWILMNAIGDKHYKIDEILKNSPKKNGESYIFDIELRVNGVELNFSNYITEMLNQMDDYIESKAKRLLKNKCEDLIEKFKENCEELTDSFEDRLYK